MIEIIYRCCELETGTLPKKPARPAKFSKESCLLNILEAIKESQYPVKFTMVHDGNEGPLIEIFRSNCDGKLIKINHNSNHHSLMECLDYAQSVDQPYIYFLEDDYIHFEKAIDLLIDGLTIFNNSIISLYDHPDRYKRIDDIDYGKTHVYVNEFSHWRSAESTTCTWATSKLLYNNILYRYAKKYGLNDREFFRSLLREQNIQLFTPIPGRSTHCHLPFLSPLQKLQF